jgi:hypothetical protein
MTLREAAEKTGRSITTLRRYIRSGRLHAEKRYGRFGPEYYVSAHDLSDAGLEPVPGGRDRSAAAPPRDPDTRLVASAEAGGREPQAWFRDFVPLTLYQELQMKHEQLLVQYGMLRAGGLRAMQPRSDLQAKQRSLAAARDGLERSEKRHEQERSQLREQLRAAELELAGRRLEIDALQQKVKTLEMMTRNAVTNESLDDQLRKLYEQSDRVRKITEARREAEGSIATPPLRQPNDSSTTDH